MKKLLLISFITAIVFTSCDYVENPNPEKNKNVVSAAGCPTPVFPAVTNHIKKILIEDYNGHLCLFCPGGALAMNSIIEDPTYAGQIIGLGVHVSDLAAPSPGAGGTPSTAFTAEFRTAAGKNYDDFFKMHDQGLPQGMINRKGYTANLVKPPSSWAGFVSTIYQEPSVVDLQIAADYDESSRKICIAVRDSFLTTMNDTLNLVVLLAQDSIINWQDVYTVYKPNYVHQHVLRDAITTPMGDALISGNIPSGTTHIKNYAYILPAKFPTTGSDVNKTNCEAKQCHLIAFIYKKNTYEIIQVEEVKVIE